MQVSITVNGEARSDDVEPRLLLAHYIRDVCGLKATNIGCDTTSCGACTVLHRRRVGQVLHRAHGAGRRGRVGHYRSRAWWLPPVTRTMSPAAPDAGGVQAAEHGLQCGFCTPGMVMAASTSLLAENPHPTETEVREGLEGNLCRCTGYHNIVRAVLRAAGGHDGPLARARRSDPGTRSSTSRAGSVHARSWTCWPSTAMRPSCWPAATRCCR